MSRLVEVWRWGWGRTTCRLAPDDHVLWVASKSSDIVSRPLDTEPLDMPERVDELEDTYTNLVS
jgi:hypothetical protein